MLQLSLGSSALLVQPSTVHSSGATIRELAVDMRMRCPQLLEGTHGHVGRASPLGMMADECWQVEDAPPPGFVWSTWEADLAAEEEAKAAAEAAVVAAAKAAAEAEAEAAAQAEADAAALIKAEWDKVEAAKAAAEAEAKAAAEAKAEAQAKAEDEAVAKVVAKGLRHLV